MNPKTNRKKLQKKINVFLGTFVKTVTDNDSKKLKKSIKKASRLLAKAVLRCSEEREIINSLQDKPAPKRTAVIRRKVAVKKNVKPAAAKHTQHRTAHFTRKPLPAASIKKADGMQAPQSPVASTSGVVVK